jgi:hypothetical protein
MSMGISEHAVLAQIHQVGARTFGSFKDRDTRPVALMATGLFLLFGRRDVWRPASRHHGVDRQACRSCKATIATIVPRNGLSQPMSVAASAV